MEYSKLGNTDIEVSKLLNMRLIWDITFLTRQMDILPEQVRNIWDER